ncbi:hypothetical protein [Actinophytocola gossypii]|uniref:Uncharacterized protein n=1 Tax=Actinophytocola gossypii TaxID=2812003 RepID=A0ABT2J922_9PSEU|nr:hypothetical protein [Actinophytocola gossypii]MCT2584281.1 hypothetical protein [Actinophytocola gossypii]
MSRNRNLARAAVLAGAAAVASIAMALPAQAHGSHAVTCDGTLGERVVRGGVVVADGTACVLDGTSVRGTVTVGAGASLELVDAKVYGGVTMSGSGRVNVTGSFVAGDVDSTGTGVVRLTDTLVVGDVDVREQTSFAANGLTAGGDVRGTTVNRFDVRDSAVLGSVSATESFSGGNLCGNVVFGDATFAGSGGAVLVGGAESCAGNQVGDDVVVRDNVAFTSIGGNTVRDDLSCTGNEPAPQVGTNTVKGDRIGQCA